MSSCTMHIYTYYYTLYNVYTYAVHRTKIPKQMKLNNYSWWNVRRTDHVDEINRSTQTFIYRMHKLKSLNTWKLSK